MCVGRRPLSLALPGLALIVLGCLSVVVSYFLLPLTVSDCFDVCGYPIYTYAWEVTLRALAPYDFQAALVSAFILVALNLPLLAPMTMVGGSVGFLVHPHRAFAAWNVWAWRAGMSAVVLLFLFVIFLSRPDLGYAGMWVGYGLLWVGNRLPVRKQP